MSYIFVDCSSTTTLVLWSFNTKKVTDMRGMFKGYVKLRGTKKYDTSNFDETMINSETDFFTKKSSISISQTNESATIKAIFSIDSRRLKRMQLGLNIVRMSNGTTLKIIKNFKISVDYLPQHNNKRIICNCPIVLNHYPRATLMT